MELPRIADTGPVLLRTLYTANAGGEVRAEQSGIGSFIRQTSYGRKSQVDCRRRVVRLLEEDAIWFSRIGQDVIARRVFTSVTDLARKLIRYIGAYSKTARPFNRVL